MSSQYRKLIGALAVAGALAIGASPAAASQPAVHCGQTLTKSVKLKADLVNCPGDGLVIGGSGITVDLNGHTIDGVSEPSASCDRPEHPTTGIANHGVYDEITVENGTIQQFDRGFDAGSSTDGMSDSRLHDLVVRANRFGGISFGTAVIASDVHNQVDHNVVVNSPCGSGIEVNTGQANTFSGNRIEDVGTGIVICCGSDSDGNVAEGNRIRKTGGAGVLVFQSGGTRIVGNMVGDIGEHAITIIGSASRDALVAGNVITRAQFSGVNVEGCPDCGEGPTLNHVRVAGNHISSTADGITLFETDDDAVSGNVVTGAGSFGAPDSFGTGVLLDAVNRTTVRGNTVANGGQLPSAGILVGLPPAFEPGPEPVDDNVVVHNTVTGQRDGDGILVGANATGTAVRRNRANHDDKDGIHVLGASSTLTGNLAFGNGAFGIEAVDGVTDGGGNVAHGNGNAVQCTGVTCS